MFNAIDYRDGSSFFLQCLIKYKAKVMYTGRFESS